MSGASEAITSNGAGRLAQVESTLFFIVGCGRSGTTLLQSALLSHPAVTIPPETKFYGAFWSRAWLYGDVSKERTFRRMIRTIWEDQRLRGIETDLDRYTALAEAAPRSWEGLFLALLAAYGDRRDAVRVGEKSPVHTHYVGHLAEAFPRARFIHLIRDPRAVVLSRIKAGFGDSWCGPHIDRWARAMEMHRRYADELGPERYLLVSYESLVTDMGAVLRRICDLIDLELVPEMLEPHRRKDKGFSERSAGWMDKTLEPVFTSSIDKWKQDLTPRHTALVEHVLGDDMRSMNYEPSGARTFAPGLQYRGSLLAGRTRAAVNWVGRATRRVLKGRRGVESVPESRV